MSGTRWRARSGREVARKSTPERDYRRWGGLSIPGGGGLGDAVRDASDCGNFDALRVQVAYDLPEAPVDESLDFAPNLPHRLPQTLIQHDISVK